MQALQTAPFSDGADQTSIEDTQAQDRPSINEMRDLVGLAPIETPFQESEERGEGSESSHESLIDDEDFAEETNLATKRKLWQQGWPKVAIVAIPLGSVCLILAFILSTIGGIKLADEDGTTGEVAVTQSTDENAIQQRQEAEIARLKTSNALGNQASILDSQPARRTEIRPATPPDPARASEPRQSEQVTQQQPMAQPQPQPTTPRTRPVAISRAPVTPASRLPVRRAEPTTAPATQVVRSQPVTRQAPVDPLAQWERLAAAGSYGQVSNSINTSFDFPSEEQPNVLADSSSNTTIPVLVSNTGVPQDARGQEAEVALESGPPRPRVMQDDYRNEKAIAKQPAYEDSTYEEVQPIHDEALSIQSLKVEAVALQTQKVSYQTQGETPVESLEMTAQATEVTQQDSYEDGVSYIMRNAQPTPEPEFTRRETVILPGISARGEIVMPVAWAQDIQSTTGSIELTEDLVSNGSVIMPAGTQLTVALSEMSASGMMRLMVTSIILPEAGYEHMQISAEAIAIQGAGGQVLIAKDVSGVDSELRRLDRNQALLGALGTVGSVLNRPSSSINTVGVGGSASSTTYSSPNILGAILEGSTNTMITQRAARNQQRAAELQQRPAVWVLEHGTEIEIFISEAVNIGE